MMGGLFCDRVLCEGMGLGVGESCDAELGGETRVGGM